MPQWLKMLLLLFGAAGLCFAVLVGGVVWWAVSHKDKIARDAQAAATEGKAFGATHAKGECVDEALNHLKGCGAFGLMCEANTRIRLDSCMAIAEDDGVCSGVPKPTDLVKTMLWIPDQCTRRGQPGSQACARFMNGLSQACAKIDKAP